MANFRSVVTNSKEIVDQYLALVGGKEEAEAVDQSFLKACSAIDAVARLDRPRAHKYLAKIARDQEFASRPLRVYAIQKLGWEEKYFDKDLLRMILRHDPDRQAQVSAFIALKFHRRETVFDRGDLLVRLRSTRGLKQRLTEDSMDKQSKTRRSSLRGLGEFRFKTSILI